MPKDIVVMSDGTDMIGSVLDGKFSIKTKFGAVIENQRSQLTHIDFSVDGNAGNDQMVLSDYSQVAGAVQNQSIRLQLQSNNQIITIPTADIKSIRFNQAP